MDSLWMIIILCIANFLGLFILGTMVLIPKKKNILLKPFTSYDVVHNIEKIEPIEKFEPIKKFEHIEKRREINSVAQDEIGAYESIPESSIIEGSEEMSFKDSISIKPKRKSTKKTVKRKVKKK